MYGLMNTPKWIKFIGDRDINSVADAKGYLKSSIIAHYETHGFGLYKIVLVHSGEPIGICGFLKREYLNHMDLGFAILPEFERKGYVKEASEILLSYAHTTLKVKTIMAITTVQNFASIGLLLKLGFKKHRRVRPNLEKEPLLVFIKNL
ncbi:GNAT family N-acetyltransferase [Croceitalea sp. MTPC5]|nr:GNAT family N-acetyltransferase [Croceitalea sp. MTPC5]